MPFDGTKPTNTVVFNQDGSVAWTSLEKPDTGTFLASGHLLTMGRLNGSQDFGGGSVSGKTYFVERDSSGNHVASWGLDVLFGSAHSLYDNSPLQLRTTPTYFAIEGGVGKSQLPATLAGFDLSLSGSSGWLTLALDKAGHYRYAGIWPTVMSDSGTALTPNIHSATDTDGRTFTCGHFWRQLTAFGQTFTALGTSDKDSDIVVAALDSEGTVLFAKAFGGAGADTCTDIAIDSTGGLLVTGQYQTTLDFGGGPLEATPHAATDPRTFYLARFAIDQ